MRKSWQRVSKRRPCPVCGKPDWCLVAGDDANPEGAICARVESARRCGEAGWLHVLRRFGPTWTPWRRTIHAAARMMERGGDGPADFGKLAADCAAAVRPEALDRLAVGLGVSAASLRRLGVGWSIRRGGWTFPMKSPAGAVLGIRLRASGGRKLSVRGGKEGLFIPSDLPTEGGMLLIAEGPTDTAALLDLGFDAVGRPSCTGGISLLIELARARKPSTGGVVSDSDAPGRRGAAALQAKLSVYCPGGVRVIEPPTGIKDAREWVRSGATKADVQAAIEAATARNVNIETRIIGKAHHGR